ncbi:MAG: hypothetical protein P9M13_02660 [Candidatus Ancaeobacter aquaticus]|nr:hypothetical protein [Candidatus Ancaeobacter aquaticus]
MTRMKVFIIAVCITMCGCAAQKKTIINELRPVKLQQLSFKEALDIVHVQSSEFSALKSDIQIEIKSNLIPDTQFCKGKMMLLRPDKIRMKGYKPFVPTLFDLASNGEEFWFYIPKEKKLYTGTYEDDSSSSIKLDVDPMSLISAMTFDNVDDDSDEEIVFLERSGESCVVNVLNKYLSDSGYFRYFMKRKIVISLESHKILQQAYYKNDGNVSFEVYYEKYTVRDDVSFPQQIVFVRPKTGTWVRINLLKTSFNQTFSDGVFSLDSVKGVERIEIGK